MNVKQTGVLAVLALAAMGATAFSMRAGTQGFATDRRGETIFPNIVSRLNDVASISIRDHERPSPSKNGLMVSWTRTPAIRSRAISSETLPWA